jgi:hypothetical protein
MLGIDRMPGFQDPLRGHEAGYPDNISGAPWCHFKPFHLFRKLLAEPPCPIKRVKSYYASGRWSGRSPV